METTESTAPAGGAEQHPIPDGDGPAATPEHEVIAREKGWRPKEEYEGDPEAWVAAEEFVKRQPLFDKIKVQSKKLKELEKTVEALAKHYQTNVAQAKERAIMDLRTERREAIEIGEVNRVEELDQKIAHVQKMSEQVVPPKGLAPELTEFLEAQKDWFNKDDDMTAFAVSYNETFLKKHPGELDKSLAETLKAVKRAYPEKFENQKRTSPPAVEGGTPVNKGVEKYSTTRLNQEQKLVYHQLVKLHKQMTHDDYFKSLEAAGFLE
jgi:hypothetical protein